MQRLYDAQKELNETDELALLPPHFQGELYPHQSVILYRMIDMEKHQYDIIAARDSVPDKMQTEGGVLEYNAAQLAAPFGSGKTVIIIALAASTHTVRRRPLTIPIFGSRKNDQVTIHGVDRRPFGAEGFGLPRNFTKRVHGAPFSLIYRPKGFISSTLIVVSTAVMGQWVAAFEKFAPHLNVFVIDGVRQFKAYLEHVAQGTYLCYHCVLLKDGTFSHNKKTVQTIDAMAECLPDCVWERFVVDDFDTIKLKGGTSLPPAYFTWYVSATRRRSLVGVVPYKAKEYDPDLFAPLAPGRWPILAAAQDGLLGSTLSVTCAREFCDASYALEPPVVVEYRIEPPARLALLTGVELDNEVVEALAGGAVETAAARLGFKCRTPADLVRCILKGRRDEYAAAALCLQALDALDAALAAGSRPVTPAELGDFLAAFKSPPFDWAPGAPLPGLLPHAGRSLACRQIEGFRQKTQEAYEKAGRALERMKENMKDECCQVCLLPWGETGEAAGDPASEGKFLLMCCQTLLCNICIASSTYTGDPQLIKECPNCFASLANKKDGARTIVYLPPDFKGEEISKSAAEFVDAVSPPVPAKSQSASGRLAQALEKNRDEGKVRALLQIVFALPVDAESSAPGRAPYGLLGMSTAPSAAEAAADAAASAAKAANAAASRRRVLVFSLHTESTKMLCAALREAGADPQHFGGTSRQKERLTQAYRASTRELEVLIITASNTCSGVHLPETTDVVFFHRFVKPETEAQLAGRAQRPGRVAPLRIHQLYYTTE